MNQNNHQYPYQPTTNQQQPYYQPQQYYQPPPVNRGMPWWAWILISVGGLLFFCAIILMSVNKDNKATNRQDINLSSHKQVVKTKRKLYSRCFKKVQTQGWTVGNRKTNIKKAYLINTKHIILAVSDSHVSLLGGVRSHVSKNGVFLILCVWKRDENILTENVGNTLLINNPSTRRGDNELGKFLKKSGIHLKDLTAGRQTY